MGNSSSLLTQYDLEDLQNHTNHLCEYLQLLLFGWLFCFVFPWKMGRKVALSASSFSFCKSSFEGKINTSILFASECSRSKHRRLLTSCAFTSEVLWVVVLNWNFCLRNDLRQPCRGVWRSLGFLSLLSEESYLLTFLELCLRIGMSYFL